MDDSIKGFVAVGKSLAAPGVGPVTAEMLHARTCALALAAGRIPPHVSQVDYEQAKRELEGDKA